MKVTIYGRENCSFCKRAVNLCERKNIDYQYMSIVDEVNDKQKEVTKSEVEAVIEKNLTPTQKENWTTFKSVPQILLEKDGITEYIGGFEDLNEKLRSLR